jgi:hypothetical protein
MEIMVYRIFVFNSRLLGPLTDESVLKAITGSNFDTLCAQYGLDSALIEAIWVHLALTRGKLTPFSPYLLLRYAPKGLRPLLVYAYQADCPLGRLILQGAMSSLGHQALKKALSQTCLILSIELSPEQLKDMGLLLAYEVARWAAEQGQGLVRALDGKWYRLNRQQAFIPFDVDAP